MHLHRVLVAAMLAALTSPAQAADEGVMALRDFVATWQAAYNEGAPGRIADLYAQDAVFSSGVLGTLRGKSEIGRVVANQMKQTPRIAASLTDAHQNGDVAWGYGDFTFAHGPSGHYGIVAVKESGSWRIAMHISNAVPPK